MGFSMRTAENGHVPRGFQGRNRLLREAFTPRGAGVLLALAAVVFLTLGIIWFGSKFGPGGATQAGRRTGEPNFTKSVATLLETGDDADASVAIRALAATGGEANLPRITALMNDDGWPDGLRSEAARELLKTGNDADSLAAVRGLIEIGGDSSVDTLAEIVHRASMPESLRLEAALGLGLIGSPRAGQALLAAFCEFPAPATQAQLLNSLGHFPFPQIESFWRQFLEAPDTPPELRAAAAEALANSSPEAVPFLQTMAGSDRDANVREMAAWALSAHGPDGALGPTLAAMTRTEPEPDVRRRLYEALPAQAENPAGTLLPLIQSETDAAARVAGFNAIGDAVRRGQSSALATQFETQIVPELTRIALAPGSLNVRMRAVFALRRASTPLALQALADISTTQTPQIAQAAKNGLRVQPQEP
jgi:HEAT repeat protein